MNLDDLSTQLLFTTVPIWAEGPNGNTSGTAFLFNVPSTVNPAQFIPLLVTNQHVIANAKRVVVEFIGRKGTQPDTSNKLHVDVDLATLNQYSDANLDLAVAPIGGLLNSREQAGMPLFFRSIDPNLIPTDAALGELAAMEEIVFIGYPSGLRDEKNSLPLIRRGITATPAWNDFRGKPSFLIDAGVSPGSSGSPVFILNQGAYATRTGLNVGTRVLFLGVLTSTMVQSNQGTNSVYLGLGTVTRSNVVKDYLSRVVSQLEKIIAVQN